MWLLLHLIHRFVETNCEKEVPLRARRCLTPYVVRLWDHKCVLAGAFVGVASNPEKLAETAVIEYPTEENMNEYHVYQGRKRSEHIRSESISSWWVILALVLREASTTRGPSKALLKLDGASIRQTESKGALDRSSYHCKLLALGSSL